MKINEKIMYQKFVDLIPFPTMVFMYETGRVIAINKSGKSMIAEESKIVRYLPDPQVKQMVAKQIKDKESEVFFGIEVNKNDEKVLLDIEVCNIEIDGKHLIIASFDNTDKQSFSDMNNKGIARFFWKDKQLSIKGVSSLTRRDMISKGLLQKDKEEITADYKRDNSSIELVFHPQVMEYLRQEENEIIENKQPIWGKIQLMEYTNNKKEFIKINRIPLQNKNGNVVGILGYFNYLEGMVDKDEEITALKFENSKLTKLLEINETILFRVRMDKDWSVEYVTPNVKKFGYTLKDFYTNRVTFKSIIAKEDYNRIILKINEAIENNHELIELEYRVRCLNGSYIWVKSQSLNYVRDKNSKYVECIVSDISEYKQLQEELRVSKDAFRLKLDSIINGQGTLEYITLEDLFQKTQMEVNCGYLSKLLDISCVITNLSGERLFEITNKEKLGKDVVKEYSSRASRKIFKELGWKAKKSKVSVYTDIKNLISIYAIPFVIEGKCMGFWNILSQKELYINDPVLLYLQENINAWCNSVQANIYLLKEREEKNKLLRVIESSQKRVLFTNELLTIALRETVIWEALNSIIGRILEYFAVDEILYYRRNKENSQFERQYEWVGKNKKACSLNYNKAKTSIRVPELNSLLESTSEQFYSEKIVPEYYKKLMKDRKYKSIALVNLSIQGLQDILFVFGDKERSQIWIDDLNDYLSDISNVLRVILQRMIDKDKIIGSIQDRKGI